MVKVPPLSEARHDALTDGLAWLDLVAAPVLVLRGVSVVAANAAARAAFGPARFEALPVGVDAFGGEPAAQAVKEAIEASDGHLRRTPAVMWHLSIGLRRMSMTLQAVPADHGGPDGLWVGTLEEDVASSGEAWRRDLEEIVNLLPVGVEVYDDALNALFFNRHADELFLYEDQLILQHDEWFPLGFPDPVERDRAQAEWHALVAAVRRDRSLVKQTEWTVRCRDGVTRQVRFLMRFVGEHFVVVQWDLTGQRTLEAELRRMAETDSMTGIHNRRRYLEVGEASFAAGGPLSVLVIDIDRFKRVNDRHGHAAGDVVIRAVADRCATGLGEGEVVGRLGGEEFAVLLPADAGAAAALGERLRLSVSGTPVAWGDATIPVAVSIGVATRRPEDRAFTDILARADAALYEAKRTGRGRVVSWGPTPTFNRPKGR